MRNQETVAETSGIEGERSGNLACRRCVTAQILRALEDAAVPGLEVGPTDAGLHVCVWLPPGLEDADVAAACRVRRVGVTALSSHYAVFDSERHRGRLVVGYGRAAEARILEVVGRIETACAAPRNRVALTPGNPLC
ncbi:hypothetical protein [Rubrivirga sp.]|uniref:hypothetical protein n=1 Tax=Rubrivirga sp. TaxID=1885344 RepID=UPI003C73249D